MRWIFILVHHQYLILKTQKLLLNQTSIKTLIWQKTIQPFRLQKYLSLGRINLLKFRAQKAGYKLTRIVDDKIVETVLLEFLNSKRKHSYSVSERSSNKLSSSRNKRFKNIRIEPLQSRDDLKILKSKLANYSRKGTSEDLESVSPADKSFTKRLSKFYTNQCFSKGDESLKDYKSPASKSSAGLIGK